MTNSQGDSIPHPHRKVAFAFMLLATAMNMIDLTIVNVALPSIRVDLHASSASLEWIFAAYSLVFGIGLITGGRLGDVYGRRTVFAVGVVGYIATSLVCGAAGAIGVLIAGRVGQAVFAAIMVPQVLASMRVIFPPEERFGAMGMYGATVGLATVSGPLLGALLIQGKLFGLSWQPVFLVNFPIGIAAMIGVLRFLPESRDANPPRLDLVGVALMSGALLLLLYPLVEGRSLGWPAWTVAAMVAAVPGFAAFALFERRRARTGSPLVPLSLFGRRAFNGGLALNVVASALVGYSVVLMLTLQIGLRWSPLHAAVTVLPFSAGIALASRRAIRSVGRFGAPRLIVAGIAFIVVGMSVTLTVVQVAGADLTTWEFIPGSFLSGLGLGMVIPIIPVLMLSSVDPRDAGSASGVLSTGTQIGGSIGVAIVGTIFFGALPDAAHVAAHPGDAYSSALGTVLVCVVAAYAACALLARLILPAPPKPAPAPVAPPPIEEPAPAVAGVK